MTVVEDLHRRRRWGMDPDKLHAEAVAWVSAPDDDALGAGFSFSYCCRVLSLDPATTRRALLRRRPRPARWSRLVTTSRSLADAPGSCGDAVSPEIGAASVPQEPGGPPRDNPKMAAFGDVVLDMARKAAELARTTSLHR